MRRVVELPPSTDRPRWIARVKKEARMAGCHTARELRGLTSDPNLVRVEMRGSIEALDNACTEIKSRQFLGLP